MKDYKKKGKCYCVTDETCTLCDRTKANRKLQKRVIRKKDSFCRTCLGIGCKHCMK